MDRAFEDARREYVNHISDRRGRVFASCYGEFVDRLLTVIQSALNTPDGQALIDPLYAEAIRTHMSAEDWQLKKAEVMKLFFFILLEECPFLKHEMALHLYDELRKESTSNEKV